jgi:esterase/lipase
LPMGQTTFAAYTSSTRQWLKQNRWFLSTDVEAELDANSPFELMPQLPLSQRHGILLVHGLSDSPYSFVDVAPLLAKMGFHVRTLLLEGHGSRPADLINADHRHWQQLLREQVAIFKQHVDKLYLGGFSTGANLVTHYALDDPQIQGLVLFSPGFKAKTKYAKYAPVYSWFKDWLYTPSLKRQTNYVRYYHAPSNGFAQYYHTSQELLERLEEQTFDRPVFIAVSENDSVLDVKRTLALFENKLTHPANRLIWFGNRPDSKDARVTVLAGKVPAMKVSNFSHMGVLFDAQNPYYGIEGAQRICNNGQTNPHYRDCVNRKEVWYSAWGHTEADKAHARLTFNPWFKEMGEIIRSVVFGEEQSVAGGQSITDGVGTLHED